MHEVRVRVDARLEAFLQTQIAFAAAHARSSVPVVEQVHALTTRGGKRLRPVVVAAAVECTRPWRELADAVASVGAAFELLQTYLLIHDDWMDGDPVRRGGPSVHVALSTRFGDSRLGASGAILAGDLASAYAQEMLLATPVDADRRCELGRLFADIQRDVVLGQTLDVLSDPDLDRIHDMKTGAYTVRGPLALGNGLAGGTADVARAFVGFSKPAGVAFQLRDDLMGTFGNDRVSGKRGSGDLRQGKMNAPVRVGLERLDPARQAELREVLGVDSDESVARARALLESVDARGAVEEQIVALRVAAERALETDALRPSGRRCLLELVRGLTEREA
jgi:geranylgeranyl diphosphate synthase type I